MIAINLSDYRQEIRNVVIQKQVVSALGVLMGIVFLIGINWFVEELQRDKLQSEINRLESKVRELDGKVKAVQEMQTKKARVGKIIDGIRALKTEQPISMTRLLEDMSQSLPDGTWLEGIKQAKWDEIEKLRIPLIIIKDPAIKEKPKTKQELEDATFSFIEIEGKTLSDVGVAQFIEKLEKIPYMKTVFLHKFALDDNRKTRRFAIYCYLGET